MLIVSATNCVTLNSIYDPSNKPCKISAIQTYLTKKFTSVANRLLAVNPSLKFKKNRIIILLRKCDSMLSKIQFFQSFFQALPTSLLSDMLTILLLITLFEEASGSLWNFDHSDFLVK